MRRIIGALALAGVAFAAAIAWQKWPLRDAAPEVPEWMGQPSMVPHDGDYWAVRASYPTGRFEPRWLVDAARDARRIDARLPDGIVARHRDQGGILALDPGVFTPLGPQPLNPGNEAAAGRTNVIVVDPVDTNVAYFGSDGGGVWKTTNCCSASTTWQPVTDFPEVAGIAIGDITLDPNDRNTIYAGTGDLRFGSFSFGAAGLLKSTDAGATWEVLGADVFNPFYGPSAGGFPQYQAIGKVVVDPNDSDKVIVGTKTGVFFSYDGGQNWDGPCLTNPHTSQRQDTTGLLAIDNGADTLLYAAIGTRGSPTPVQPDLGNNGANGVYRTTVPASGCPASWALLNNNWPTGTGNGTAGATAVGRIELAVAPTNPQVLYAMAANTTLSAGVLGVWRTSDGGNTWTQTATAANVPSGGCPNTTGGGGQMWYDAGLTVSPVDANIVWMSTIDLYRSTDGGANFVNKTCGYGSGPASNVHVDHHARAYIGTDPDRLLVGSDGGVWYSANATATNPTFIPLNNSINTIEFYSGDITANFATTSSGAGISGGAQDNGSNTAVFSGNPGPTSWVTRLGGDGIYTRIDPIVRSGGGQRWYYSSQNGSVRVAVNGPGGTVSTANTTWGGDTKSFVMPFELYRYGTLDAPGSGCTAADGCTRLIAGTTRIWETITGGVGTAQWYANSPTLTKVPSPLAERGFVNQLAYAVSDPTVAIAGTNDGNVQYGFGLGAGTANSATWVNVTDGNSVLPNRPILDVATDPVNPLVGYAAVGGFDQNTPATPGRVFRITCSANCATFAWQNKTGNLPNIPVDSIVANPHVPNQVFAGTDWGLYFTNDITAASPEWFRHDGLPHVMIWDMAIDRGFTTLAVFTRSRGAWAWPLPTGPVETVLFADGFED